MTDARLTKLTGALLVAVRDQVDHLIGADLVDKEQLRVTLTPAARKTAVEAKKAEGKTQRQIAKQLGVSVGTINSDLRSELNTGHMGDRSELIMIASADAPLDIPLLESPAPRGAAEIKEAAKQIRAAEAKASRAEKIERIAEISKGNSELGTSQKYPIIYAHPPWRYENPSIGSVDRSIERHYPTMSLDEICALPVRDLAADDALLYLWVTAPKIAESVKVIEAWGFEYRTCFVWVKDKIGMGYHARNQHELLFVCRRGSIPHPAPGDRVSNRSAARTA